MRIMSQSGVCCTEYVKIRRIHAAMPRCKAFSTYFGNMIQQAVEGITSKPQKKTEKKVE